MVTVSIAAATGGAAFFATARLRLALATTRFVAFPAAFLTLGRAVARFFFWIFDDRFLRLAIICRLRWRCANESQKTTRSESRQSTPIGYQQTFSAYARPLADLLGQRYVPT
jgi:hypothetical protein